MISMAKAQLLRTLIERAVVSLADEDALTGVELFPVWQSEKAYGLSDRVRCGDKLYRCVQAHKSQLDWTPDAAPSLWTEVAKPGEIPIWRQPTGAQDAYQTGDRVHYPTIDGPVYESLIDNNTWSPEAYPAGWLLVTGA